MAKRCGYCDTGNKKARYTKLPNGLYVCDGCYADKKMNPLSPIAMAWYAWRNRKLLPKEIREAMEQKGPPSIHTHQYLAILKAADKIEEAERMKEDAERL